MAHGTPIFPIIAGLWWANGENAAPVSEKIIASAVAALRKVREQSSTGVLVVYSARKEEAGAILAVAGAAEMEARRIGGDAEMTATTAPVGIQAADLEMVDACDVLIVVVGTGDGRATELAVYAERMKRPVIRIDADSG